MFAFVISCSALILLPIAIAYEPDYLEFKPLGTSEAINCNGLVNLFFADENLGPRAYVALRDFSGFKKDAEEVDIGSDRLDNGTKQTYLWADSIQRYLLPKPFRHEVANICCEARPKRGYAWPIYFLDATKAINALCDMDVAVTLRQWNQSTERYEPIDPCAGRKARVKQARKDNEQFCEEFNSEPERAISSETYAAPKDLNPTTPGPAPPSPTPTLSNHSVTSSAPTPRTTASNSWSPAIIACIVLACGALLICVGIVGACALVKSRRKFTYWINGGRAPLSRKSVAMKDSLL